MSLGKAGWSVRRHGPDAAPRPSTGPGAPSWAPRVTACRRRRRAIVPCSPPGASAGCWRPGCWRSSATASSRRRWPAPCCSTPSGRPIRSPSRRVSRSCSCPYSLVGPFAGVWLDRWSRRQVLVLGEPAARRPRGRRRRSGARRRAGHAVLHGRAGRLLGQPLHPRRAVGRAAAHDRARGPGVGERPVDDVRRRGDRGRRRGGPRPAAARRLGRRRLRGARPGGGDPLPRGLGRDRCRVRARRPGARPRGALGAPVGRGGRPGHARRRAARLGASRPRRPRCWPSHCTGSGSVS